VVNFWYAYDQSAGLENRGKSIFIIKNFRWNIFNITKNVKIWQAFLIPILSVTVEREYFSTSKKCSSNSDAIYRGTSPWEYKYTYPEWRNKEYEPLKMLPNKTGTLARRQGKP